MWPIDGQMCRIPGKQKYSSTQMVGGAVLALYSFILDTGDRYLLAVTPDKVYKFNPTTDAFDSIHDATDFTTTDNDHFAIATFFDGSGNEIAIISNLTDAVRKWDGSAGTIATLAGTPPNARTLCVFENYLLAGYTVESGTDYPRRVRYSALSNGESWPSENYFDLKKDSHQIVSIKRISGRAAVYKENSITLVDYIGGGLTFNSIENYIGDKGPVNNDCIVSYGEGLEAHYFISNDLKAYRFDGIECQPIGGNIQSIIQNINPTYKTNISGTALKEENKIVWAVPFDTDETCKDLLIYDVRDKTWWVKESEAIAVSSWGAVKLETTYTWDTLPFDKWDDWDDPGGWNSRHLIAGASEFLIGCVDGHVRKFVGGVDDDGEDIASRYRYPFDNLDGHNDRLKILTRIILELEHKSNETIILQVYKNNNDNDPVVVNDDGDRSINVALTGEDNDQQFIYKAIDVCVRGHNFMFELTSTNVAWSGKILVVEYNYDGHIPKNTDQTGDTWQGSEFTWGGEIATW